jgi:superoxide reductase
MKKLSDSINTNDWKKEKHIPVIDCPDSVIMGESFAISIKVGKEIPHPNTTEHHIRWIQVFFKPADDKFIYQVAYCEFTAHGESVAGPDQGYIYTDPSATAQAIIKKPGTIHVLSYCNIHGLWENSKDILIV